MSLVWLFKEHRALDCVRQAQNLQLTRLVDENLELKKDNTELSKALKTAHDAIQSNPTYINSVMDILQKYQEKVLEELPFAHGQEPEWLTPSPDDIRTMNE